MKDILELETLITLATPLVKKLALAIVVLIVGLYAIKKINRMLEKKITHSRLDNTLKPFICSAVRLTLKILLVISLISILDIDTTSFVAIIASAGLAIGLAFQGTLSNFAGGVLLLTLRPFKAGDFIEANGISGTVEAIQLLYTHITTPDNKVIFIPNGKLSNESIVNFSVKETRRVELKFTVGYECNAKHVKDAIMSVIDHHDLVLREPNPFVRMSEHADSAIVFTVRVWVKASDYWNVHFDLIELIKKRFDEENISIPYPQMDVHLNSANQEDSSSE